MQRTTASGPRPPHADPPPSLLQIHIRLLSSQAPQTTKLVYELAKSNGCTSCKFYRHEPVPEVS